MGKRWLLNGIRCRVVPLVSFTDTSDGYFDQAWLRNAIDLVGGRTGNVN
jgi:hypothetical protein